MWVKLDDSFPEHPKMVPLSDAAFRLHITCLCYCGRNLTDGFVPVPVATRYGTELIDELLEAGAWLPPVPGKYGPVYEIVNFLEYNPSRAEVEGKRKAAADRVRRHRKRRGEPVATLGAVDLDAVWARDGGLCGICGAPADPDEWQLDHVKPLSAGGEHTMANVQVAHPGCNASKGGVKGMERRNAQVTRYAEEGSALGHATVLSPPTRPDPTHINPGVGSRETAAVERLISRFNELFGTRYTAKAWADRILERARAYPEVSLDEHLLILEAAAAKPWWKDDRPTPSVIWGEKVFEQNRELAARHSRSRRAQQAAQHRRDEERAERERDDGVPPPPEFMDALARLGSKRLDDHLQEGHHEAA